MKTNWTVPVFRLLLALALVCALAVPAYAVAGGASISGASGQRGSTVSLGISVSPDEQLEAIGFSLSYDSSVLEWVSGSWSAPNPLIASTDSTGGAWGSTSPQSVGGQVATMTFRIRDDAPIGSSGVTCTVKMANSNGDYTTSASTAVTVTCEHTYGDWSKLDGNSHQRVCSKCSTPDAQPHVWGEPNVTSASTCEKQGTAVYTCTVCGETKTEKLSLAEHTWDAGKVTRQPNCKEQGERTFTCTVCSVTRAEAIPTTADHQYGSWEKFDANSHRHVCTVCEKAETAAHSWDAGKITKQPSCAAEGTRLRTCTVCGETKTEAIAKTADHNWSKWESSGTGGHKRVCSTCGKTETAGHNWDSGTVTSQPDCKTPGQKLVKCTVCAESKTEAIPVTDVHRFGKWESVGAAQHKHVCEVCGRTETAAHTWDAGKVTKQATCAAEGETLYTCTACGATRTEAIPKTTEHTWGKWEHVSADGHRQTCAVCGRVTTAAHTWDAGKITQKATCKEPGVKTFTCTACGGTKTEAVTAPDAHVWGEWTQSKAPTCTEKGAQTRTCQLCGATEQRELDATNHPETVTKDAKKATCTTGGYSGDVYCTVCNALVKKGTETKPTGHTTVVRNAVAASCNSTGYSGDRYCKTCGVLLSYGTTTAKTAHTWDSGKITRVPTETENGEKTITCTKCGEIKLEVLPKGTVPDGKLPVVTEAPATTEATTQTEASNPKTGETPAEPTEAPTETQAQTPAKKSANPLPIILLVVTGLALIAAVVLYLYIRYRDSNSGTFAR